MSKWNNLPFGRYTEMYRDYCKFEKEKLRRYIDNIRSEIARRIVIESSSLMTFTQFLTYLDELPSAVVAKLVRRWRSGYEKYLNRRSQSLARMLEKNEQKGLPGYEQFYPRIFPPSKNYPDDVS